MAVPATGGGLSGAGLAPLFDNKDRNRRLPGRLEQPRGCGKKEQMQTQTGLELRLARRSELEEIGRQLPGVAGDFFSERFPGRTAADFCRWKYYANPDGEALVGVAVDGDKVVSIVAATPKRIQVNSEIVQAFELGDFLTDKQYRRRGLFSSLIQLVCSRASERGAAFCYVRPNDLSYPILAKGLSFAEVQKIDARRYVLPSGLIHRKTGLPARVVRLFGLDWLAGRLAFSSGGKSLDVQPVTRFEIGMDEFWQRVRKSYSFSLVRDCSYLNWRYVDCPTPYKSWIARRNSEIAGYVTCFVSPSEHTGYVVDLVTEPGDREAAGALLKIAAETMLDKGAHTILCWTLKSGALSASSKLLQRACPFVYKPHLHVAMRFLRDGFGTTELPTTGWQLAIGDFDGI
jgi:GNAT superfamily N-acetyltransferase